MGLIDSAISGAMEAVGSGMMDTGNFFSGRCAIGYGKASLTAMRYVGHGGIAWRMAGSDRIGVHAFHGHCGLFICPVLCSWMDAQFRRNPEQFFHRRGF